ncbi:MAG: hypothetical protein AB8B80_05215 [Marinicellaceae bacterium]
MNFILKLSFFILIPIVFAGCQSGKDASAFTNKGEKFIGFGSNQFRGAKVKIASLANGSVCIADIKLTNPRPVAIVAKLGCTDGRTGSLKLFQGIGGKVKTGSFTLSDGSSGRIFFGNANFQSNGSSDGNNYSSDSISPNGSVTFIYTPNDNYSPSNSGACKSEGYYGEISCLTGRPKTISVSGYYRKNGTYVKHHYRSRPN